MTIRYRNRWEDRPQISELVDLPHQGYPLQVSCSGKARLQGEPLLIFFTGGAAPFTVYMKVQEALKGTIRSLFYNRSGYDQSGTTDVDSPFNAQQNAAELDELLHVTGQGPPYLLVGHSYGGIVARVFLEHLLSKHNSPSVRSLVCGLVLFDTATELMLSFFPRIPPEDLLAVMKNVTWNTNPDARLKFGFTEEEWRCVTGAIDRTVKNLATRPEDTHGSAWDLAKKRQLDRSMFVDGVLDIVSCNIARTFREMYDEGVKTGGGTPQQRESALQFIEKIEVYSGQMARAQLDLVSEEGKRRYRYLPAWGHDSPMENPKLVVECVEWVLQQPKGG